MKLLLLAILFLFTTASYVASVNDFRVSSPSAVFLTGRKSLREQRVMLIDDRNDKVLEESMKQMAIEEHHSRNDLELVYHIDYNGVTTHPVPTPKHPRP